MNTMREVTHQITVADQPTEADLKFLKDEGYVGVVNVRNDGEPEQPMSTAEEGEKVRALGMDYLHYGVGAAPLSEQGVASVCDFLDQHAQGKVLVHCRKGGRASALVLLHLAETQGWGPDEALQNGNAMGLAVEGGLKPMVQTFIREHWRG
jgi:uncharacterized protein (TIGR01244 family)